MPITSQYDRLVKAHGTYREFEDAVWNTLGETSIAECQEACAKYREELAIARLADLNAARARNHPCFPGS